MGIAETYVMKRKLGEGSGGVIYLAYHKRLQKDVVIKQIKYHYQDVHKYRREVDILKNLHHTYLPQVLDFFEENGDVFTVMSFIPGKSLQQLIDEGYHFTQNQLIRWGMQLCNALNYLHSQNPPIIHSDIKPSNIMLTPQGNICLIDFNISFYLDGTTMIGYTNGYSSPEQKTLAENQYHQGIILDDKTDIYSIGATFYYLITGQKILSGNPQISLLEDKVSEAFISIVLKATEYDKSKRFKNAHEMFKAFQGVAERDQRYLNLIKKYRFKEIGMVVLLIVSILTCGFGIHQLQLERVEKYNTLVEEQIEFRENRDFVAENQKFEDAKNLIPTSMESYYQHALTLYEQEEYTKCIDFISYDILENEKLNLSQEKTADVYYIKANCHFKQENYDASVESYEKLFQYGGYNYTYYRDYAIALAYDGDYQKANEILQEAIDQGMDNDSIYFAKGEICQSLNKNDDALDYFIKCVELTQDDELKERSYLLIDAIYQKNNDFMNCRKVLQEACNVLPVNRQLIVIERLIQTDINLAQKENNSQYQKEAVKLLEQVIENHWDTYNTYDNLVILNQKLKNYAKANEYLQVMISLYGDDYNIYKRLAFLEIDIQELSSNENRDYTSFQKYYQTAKSMYKETDDPEMILLDDVYQQVIAGGWL